LTKWHYKKWHGKDQKFALFCPFPSVITMANYLMMVVWWWERSWYHEKSCVGHWAEKL